MPWPIGLHTTHGMTRTPEYRAWQDMRQRCSNPKSRVYKQYGARGVKVCDEWNKSFTAFYKDVGPRPEEHELDRINPNGNYEPGNVRWNPSYTGNKRRPYSHLYTTRRINGRTP